MSEAIIFEFPYNLFIKQRLEFVLICQDDLEALILRLVEAGMIKQKEDWQNKVLAAVEAKKTPPKEPRTYWVRLSHGQIIARLYKYDSKKVGAKHPLSLSKSTIRNAINSLIEKGFLVMRSKPGDEFGSPIYTLNRVNIQKALKELPSDPFSIFAYGGVSNFESGEFQNLEVPPTNFESGDVENLEVGLTENESGEFQNLEVNKDIDIDNLEDSKDIEQEEGVGSGEPTAPANLYHFTAEKKKRDTDKHKAVKIGDTNDLTDYPNSQQHSNNHHLLGDRNHPDREIQIEGNVNHDRDDLSSDRSNQPGDDSDKRGSSLSAPGDIGQNQSVGGTERTVLVQQAGTDELNTPSSLGIGTAPAQRSALSPSAAVQGADKRKSKRVTQATPPEAVRIMDDWDSLFKRPSPRTDNHIKAAESLIASNPTKEDLDNVRKFCFSSNPDWYRNKGVTLIDVSRNFGKWQSLQEVEPIPMNNGQPAKSKSGLDLETYGLQAMLKRQQAKAM